MVEDYYNNGWLKRAGELELKDQIGENQRVALQDMMLSPDEENAYLAKEIMRLKISEALLDGLNEGQKKAFIQVVDFFRSDGFDAVILKGYAGTGKTFLVKRIIEYITTAYPNRKIAITAPTNKAVHVLNRNTPFGDNSAVFEEYNEPNSKIVYSTIHKLLGLKESISNTGVQSFVTGKDTDLTKYKYLILDEVSMLNDDLFEKLMKFNDKVKFIFMGDPAQIPPINSEHCAPFQDTCKYNLMRLELTEIMRQKGENAIVDNSMTLRQNLIKPEPIGKINTTLNSMGHGVIHMNAKTNRAMVRKVIEKLYRDPQYDQNTDFVKIIAWKNKTVAYLNNLVKEVIFGDKKKRFNIGDNLVANKALFTRSKNEFKWSGNDMMYKIKANTSDEFNVTNVKIITRTFQESVKGSPKVNFTGDYYKLTTLNSLNETEILYVLHEDFHKEFMETLIEMKQLATSKRSGAYWKMYYTMLKWSDDIAYNYAITAHKSQGSTYQNVILIEEDLNANRKVVERNRIKYTAYTRASQRVYILK